MTILIRTVAKILVAVVALVALLALVMRGLVPGASATDLVFIAALVLVVGVLLVTISLIASLQFRQWVLRKGGVDPQWLWFRADPPGLERLRARTGSTEKP